MAAEHGEDPHDPHNAVNWEHARIFAWIWIGLIVLLISYHSIMVLIKYLRKISCLNNENQRYFNDPPVIFGLTKRYLLDAPLFRKRHHRELMLGSKIHLGSIPNRMQAIFVVCYVAALVVLTFIRIDYSAPERMWQTWLMRRSGTLAIMNLLPLFLLSGRNNPLIKLCGISFDTYNLLHRWVGRAVVFEALVHGITYFTKKVHHGGWHSLKIAFKLPFTREGLAAFTALCLIILISPAPFRRAFYETFLHLHQALAVAFLAAVWLHTEEYTKHHDILKAVVAIWVLERLIRLVRLVIHNFGHGGTRAEVSILPGDAVQIKMTLARPWSFAAGQHAYIYLPRIGWWTSHPFSVAWCDDDDDEHSSDGRSEDIEKETSLPTATRQQSIHSQQRSWATPQGNIYFIVRRKRGFTEKLWRKAATSPNGVFTTRAFAEGPYNEQKLHSYGTVLLFATGVGITHSVPHMKELVQGYGYGTVATRKVVLIWILQSPEHLEWIREWMTTILALPNRRDVLKILLYVSRPQDNREIYSPSSSVQVFPGKPNVQAVVDEEVSSAIGAIGVSCCGIGALADDVRAACRSWMGKVNIDFEEESFSW